MSTRFLQPQREKLFLDDFIYTKQQDCYVHVPTGKIYTRREINRLFPPVPVLANEADEADEAPSERRN
jgi:hypothetical protein